MEKTHRYAQESSTIDRARRKLADREKEISPATNLQGSIQKVYSQKVFSEVKSQPIAAPSPEVEAIKATLEKTPEDPRIATLRQKINFNVTKK